METVNNSNQEPDGQAAVLCVAETAIDESGMNKVFAANSKRGCLLVILALSLVRGFMTGILEEDSSFVAFLDIAVPIGTLFGILIWCMLDSEERNMTLTKKMLVAIILVLVFAFPYYILTTRSRLKALGTIGLSILFVVFCGGLYAVGEYFGEFLYNLKNGY
jgi:hypothetical protein